LLASLGGKYEKGGREKLKMSKKKERGKTKKKWKLKV
jgi:hypothetical protein